MTTIEAPVKKFLSIEEIIGRLSSLTFNLQQDTKDIVQLNPIERLKSINKVWDACKSKVGSPQLALDVGTGFGYGTVFLESQGIKTIGIENVGKKIKQGQDLFSRVKVNIPRFAKLDFSQHPAFYEGDINSISNTIQADLITVFYLSLGMISEAETFKTLQKLLKKDGKVLLATEASVEEVRAFFEHHTIPVSFSYEVVKVPDNFEKTAIILRFE